jgi:heme-degrading monooxygenase HmoA
MFAVIYRWKAKPGTEDEFRTAWRALTEAIAARYGTSGSRLHRAANDEYVAYAVWPSRARWEEAGKGPSADPDAGARMRACIETSHDAEPLAVIDDLLKGPADG